VPALSKQQQKLFGLALSVKRGDTPRSEVSDEIKDIVDNSKPNIQDISKSKRRRSDSGKLFSI